MQAPKQLDDLAQLVSKTQGEHAQLTALLAAVQNNKDVFFDSEIDKVSTCVAAKAQQLQALQTELQTRVRVFENDVAMLHQALEKRQSIIEAVDNDTHVLRHNNSLLNTFAQGQVTIQNDLERLRKRVGVDP